MSEAGFSDDGFGEFDNTIEDDFGLQQGGPSAPPEGSQAGLDVEAAQPVNVVELFPNSDNMAKPRCVSCIAYVNLHVPVDLRELACNVCNIEFNPARSNAAIMRIRDPSCVGLIRNSGIITLTGAASVPAAKRAAEIIARVVRKGLNLGDKLSKITFRVKSLNVHFDLKHPIRLDDLHLRYPEGSYEPESFCGCIVKLHGEPSNPWHVTCSVFVSGKVAMMGAKTAKQVEAAYNKLLPMLAPFAKNSGVASSIIPPSSQT